MAAPIIAAGIATIARFMAKKGMDAAVKKFGKDAVKQADRAVNKKLKEASNKKADGMVRRRQKATMERLKEEMPGIRSARRRAAEGKGPDRNPADYSRPDAKAIRDAAARRARGEKGKTDYERRADAAVGLSKKNPARLEKIYELQEKIRKSANEAGLSIRGYKKYNPNNTNVKLLEALKNPSSKQAKEMTSSKSTDALMKLRYNKGGYANCGASVSPNGKSRT